MMARTQLVTCPATPCMPLSARTPSTPMSSPAAPSAAPPHRPRCAPARPPMQYTYAQGVNESMPSNAAHAAAQQSRVGLVVCAHGAAGPHGAAPGGHQDARGAPARGGAPAPGGAAAAGRGPAGGPGLHAGARKRGALPCPRGMLQPCVPMPDHRLCPTCACPCRVRADASPVPAVALAAAILFPLASPAWHVGRLLPPCSARACQRRR